MIKLGCYVKKIIFYFFRLSCNACALTHATVRLSFTFQLREAVKLLNTTFAEFLK